MAHPTPPVCGGPILVSDRGTLPVDSATSDTHRHTQPRPHQLRLNQNTTLGPRIWSICRSSESAPRAGARPWPLHLTSSPCSRQRTSLKYNQCFAAMCWVAKPLLAITYVLDVCVPPPPRQVQACGDAAGGRSCRLILLSPCPQPSPPGSPKSTFENQDSWLLPTATEAPREAPCSRARPEQSSAEM